MRPPPVKAGGGLRLGEALRIPGRPCDRPMAAGSCPVWLQGALWRPCTAILNCTAVGHAMETAWCDAGK
jgi:hypothetical protein